MIPIPNYKQEEHSDNEKSSVSSSESNSSFKKPQIENSPPIQYRNVDTVKNVPDVVMSPLNTPDIPGKTSPKESTFREKKEVVPLKIDRPEKQSFLNKISRLFRSDSKKTPKNDSSPKHRNSGSVTPNKQFGRKSLAKVHPEIPIDTNDLEAVKEYDDFDLFDRELEMDDLGSALTERNTLYGHFSNMMKMTKNEQEEEQEIQEYHEFLNKQLDSEDEETEVDKLFREITSLEFYEREYNISSIKNDRNTICDLFPVKKNDFELNKIYSDPYPFLNLRKKINHFRCLFSLMCYKIMKNKIFEAISLTVIIMNTITLIIDDPNVENPIIVKFDLAYLIIYTIEMGFKIFALGFIMDPKSYLRDSWNILDFTIIATAYLPYLTGSGSGVNLSSLRSLRVLRPLRTISTIKDLKVILVTLFNAGPAILQSLLINIFFLLIFAIGGVQLFSGLLKKRCFEPETGFITPDPSINIYVHGIICGYTDCPADNVCGKIIENPNLGIINFDNIMYSFLMVFQCITLEGWSQIMWYVVSSFSIFVIPYFIVLIWIGAFFLVNLTLAVITNQYKSSTSEDYKMIEEKENDPNAITIDDIRNLKMAEKGHHKRVMRRLGLENLYGASEEDKEITRNQNMIRWDDLFDYKSRIEEEKKNQMEEEKFRNTRDKEIGTAYRKLKRTTRNRNKSIVKSPLMQISHMQKELFLKNKLLGNFGMKGLSPGMKGLSLVKPLVLALESAGENPLIEDEEDQFLNNLSKNKDFQKPKDFTETDIFFLREKKKNKFQANNVKIQNDKRLSFLTNEETTEGSNKPFLQRKSSLKNQIIISNGLKRQSTLTSDRPKSLLRRSGSIKEGIKRNSVQIENNLDFLKGLAKDSKNKNTNDNNNQSLDNSLANDSDFNLPGFELYDIDINKDSIPHDIKDTKLAEIVEQSAVEDVIFAKDKNEKKGNLFKDKIQKTHLFEKNFIAKAFTKADEPEENLDILKDGEIIQEINEIENTENLNEISLNNQNSEIKISKVKKTNFLRSFTEKRKLKKREKKLRENLKRRKKFNVLHYKLEINEKIKYQSSSHHEVLESENLKLEYQKILKFFERLRSKNYTINYTGKHINVKKQKKLRRIREKQLIKMFEEQQMQLIDGHGCENLEIVKKILKIPDMNSKFQFSRTMLPLRIRTDFVTLIEKQRSKYSMRAQSRASSRSSFSSKTSNSNNEPSSPTYPNNGQMASQYQKSVNTSFQKKKKVKKVKIPEIIQDIEKGIKDKMYSNEDRLFRLKDFRNDKDYDLIKNKDWEVGIKQDIIKVVVKTKKEKIDEYKKQLIELELKEREEEKIKEKLEEQKEIQNRNDNTNKKRKNKKKKKKKGEKTENKIPPPKEEDDYRTFHVFWSGEDVIKFRPKESSTTEIFFYNENKLRNNLNSILFSLSTASIDKIIWLPGIKGHLTIWHKKLKRFVKSSFVDQLMLLAVIINTTILAMDGLFYDQATLDVFQTISTSLTITFAIEMGLKLIALTPKGYAEDKMNLFDGGVVMISIVELFFLSGTSSLSAFRTIRIFRTFRVLRVSRLLRALDFMKIIIEAINAKIKTFTYIGLLLFLLIVIYALIGTQLFSQKLASFEVTGIRQNFDNFLNAFIAVFQLMTMENWNDILTTTFNSGIGASITSIYLISWIFLGNYVFLNLILATMLDGFETVSLNNADDADDLDDDQKQEKIKKEKELEMQKLRNINNMDEDELNEKLLVKKKLKSDKPIFEGVSCDFSIFIFSKKSYFRKMCYRIVHSELFDNFILFLIVLSSIKLAIDTYFSEDDEDVTKINDYIDIVFNSLFIMECVLKIIAFGFAINAGSYLRDSWSILDFFIVLSSILDMSVQGINLPVIKILRLLRTLRPLRFISHNDSMRIVVKALLNSIGGIFNVSIVVILIFLMFSILGMSLIGERMGFCEGQADYYGINKIKSVLKSKWKIYDANFDNIFNAMITIFILSTQENWPEIMYRAVDSDMDDAGPTKDGYSMISLFFVGALLVCNVLLINLFVGVLYLRFSQAQEEENPYKLVQLTQTQQRWLDFQKMILSAKPNISFYLIPNNKVSQFTYKIISHSAFESFVMGCIVMNIVTMAMNFEGETQQYSLILSNINYFFTSIFFLECILKHIGLGCKGYWSSGWNKFDFFVVCASVVDILMDSMGASFISFLRVGPQLARIMRVLRVSRLLKLVKSLKELQCLLEALILSLPAMINVAALLFLVYFIYAVLGVFLFKSVKIGRVIDEYNNFSNFHNGVLLLFRCSTGENWWVIMYDLWKTNDCNPELDCGNMFSPLFFITFMVIASFIMLNLFVLIIVDQYDKYVKRGDSPGQIFNDLAVNFRKKWAVMAKETNGIKLPSKYLIDFFKLLGPPLGFKLEDSRAAIAKAIMEMNLSGDDEKNVYFNDVLFCAIKNGYGSDIFPKNNVNPITKELILKEELKTKNRIEKIKKFIIRKSQRRSRSFSSFFRSSFNKSNIPSISSPSIRDFDSGSSMNLNQDTSIVKRQKKNMINPIYTILFVGMVWKAWSKFSINLIEKKFDKNDSFKTSSESESDEEYIQKEESEKDDDDEFDEDEEQLFEEKKKIAGRKVGEFFQYDHRLEEVATIAPEKIPNDNVIPEQIQNDKSFSSSSPKSNSKTDPSKRFSVVEGFSNTESPTMKMKRASAVIENTKFNINNKEIDKLFDENIVFEENSSKESKESGEDY